MFINLTLDTTEDGITTITFIRENALNALNNETVQELTKALSQLTSSTRVLVFKGKGKSFIAGADITEFKNRTIADAKTLSIKLQSIFNTIEILPIPTIAAVNGYCLGGGSELAMACDFRIASDKAIFGQPEIKLGLIPGAGGTQRLPRLVGKTMAKEIIFLGDHITAARAYEIGLVNKVVPAEEFDATVNKFAARLARGPLFALAQAKEAINRGTEMAWLDGIRMESSLFALCFAHPDVAEGVDAFLSKRRAQFK